MRRMVCAALVLTPTLLAAAPASAAAAPVEIQLGVDASTWTWRQTLPGIQPSNVPPGDLPVQFDGRPDAPPAKATYLRLAFDVLPAGTVAQALTVTLPLDPAVDQDASAAPLVACRLTAAFVTGEAADPADAPAEDCTDAVEGSYDEARNAVAFTLTPFAGAWLAGANAGFVVRPDPAADVPAVLPFQLSFQGATSVEAALLAVLPAAVVPPAAPAPNTPLVPQLPVPQSGPVFVAPVPQVQVPVPVPLAPVIPPPAQPDRAVAIRVPASVPAAGHASAAGFAMAAALGALLLALMGWSLGSACDPAPIARRERGRLDRLLAASRVSAQPRQIRQGRRPSASAASTVT